MSQQVTKDMSIMEVLNQDRNTARIFMEYGMHCLGCPHASAESIGQASEVHGIDADALIDAINLYMDTREEKFESL